MDEKVQLSKETIVGNDKVETDIFPNTNTNSVINTRNGLNMSETIETIWAAINNKLSRVVNSVNGRTGVVVLDASDVGLENVDNVSFNDIKQWVIEELGDEFDNKHLRIYDSLSDLNIELNANDLDLKNSPLFIKRYDNDDVRSYIGYLTTDTGGDHLQAVITPLNTIGETDKSLVYYDDTSSGYTAGKIKVKISSNEDALKVNITGNDSEKGLYIDKSKFGGHLHFFDGAYGDGITFNDSALFTVNPNTTPFIGDPLCEVYIDGEKICNEYFHHRGKIYKNDIIACNFKDYRIGFVDNASSYDPDAEYNHPKYVLNADKVTSMLVPMSGNGQYHINDIIEVDADVTIKFTITGISEIKSYKEWIPGLIVKVKPDKMFEDGTSTNDYLLNEWTVVSRDSDIITISTEVESDTVEKEINGNYAELISPSAFVATMNLLYCEPVSYNNIITGNQNTKPIYHPYDLDKYHSHVGTGLTVTFDSSDWILSKYNKIDDRIETSLMNRGWCLGYLTSLGSDETGNPDDVWRIDFFTQKHLLGSGLTYKTKSNFHNGDASLLDIKLRRGHFNQFGIDNKQWDVSGLCVVEDWGRNRTDGDCLDVVSGSGNTAYNPGRNKRYAVTPSGVVDMMSNDKMSEGGLTIMTDLSLCLQPHYMYAQLGDSNSDISVSAGSYAVENWHGHFPSKTILNDNDPPSYVGINLMKGIKLKPYTINGTFNQKYYLGKDRFVNLSGLKIIDRDVRVDKGLLGKQPDDIYYIDDSGKGLDIDGMNTSGGLMVNVGKGLEIAPYDDGTGWGNYYEGGKVDVRVDNVSIVVNNKNRLALNANTTVYHDIDIYGNYHPVYNALVTTTRTGETIAPSVYVNTRHGLGLTVSSNAPQAIELKIKAMSNGNEYKYREYNTAQHNDTLLFDPDGLLISPIDVTKGLKNTYRAEIVSIDEHGNPTISETGGLAINVGTGLAFDADGKLYATGETEHNIIDEALSPDSTHAVQNKAIYNAINAIGNPIATVEENSEKTVQSKGIYTWTVDLMSKTDGKFYGTFDSKTALDASQDPKAKNDYAYVKGETTEGDATQGKVKGLDTEHGGYLKLHATDTNDPDDPDIGNKGINQNGMILPILATGTYCYKVKFNNIEGWANKEYIDLITEETQYVRYKFTGTQWKKEFVLNNTSFTTEQISAINSTITAEVVTQVKAHLLDTTSNPHQVTKAMVGLGNVDNTSDLDKPISTAATTKFTELETSINGKQDASCRQLESGTDLDECTIVSNFACDTAEIGATLLHLPNVSNVGNGPLRLEVKSLLSSASTSSTTNVIQTLYPSALPGKMYIRYCVADTWGNWFEFAGTEISSS